VQSLHAKTWERVRHTHIENREGGSSFRSHFAVLSQNHQTSTKKKGEKRKGEYFFLHQEEGRKTISAVFYNYKKNRKQTVSSI
jgi:coproporphyrinogen III oxidase